MKAPFRTNLALSLILTFALTLTNLFSVKSFGEFEYWFAMIKNCGNRCFLSGIGLAIIFRIDPRYIFTCDLQLI